MEFTYDEMREHLEAIGYDVDGMRFEEIDELAEVEGYEWDYCGRFVEVED